MLDKVFAHRHRPLSKIIVFEGCSSRVVRRAASFCNTSYF
ncbi:MAG: hypothetical protein OP8BY_1552 [Candidatus Saccharicenans subterraneus]|uniref:Uncharacterized protein n=1 Tax=Candidatus Saccharicenans subterraneus TaxID=2508984 RepID=A0A3E2BNT5_9BACT|nr:MAG: hypothetical protein OP8BY_1552 [Candidatus Saccharicenans subterraneum]